MYRLCDVSFRDFWYYTPAETFSMLEIAIDKLKYESFKRAELLSWIANAPRVERCDRKPWTINDFLPEQDQIEREMTADEIERLWWNEAI